MTCGKELSVPNTYVKANIGVGEFILSLKLKELKNFIFLIFPGENIDEHPDVDRSSFAACFPKPPLQTSKTAKKRSGGVGLGVESPCLKKDLVVGSRDHLFRLSKNLFSSDKSFGAGRVSK